MFYLKDMDIFFKDFGEECYDQDGNSFKVIFDDEYIEYDPFNSSKSINTQDLFCTVKNEDIKNYSLRAKTIIIIDNMKYVIKNIEYDRNGASKVKLQIEEEE